MIMCEGSGRNSVIHMSYSQCFWYAHRTWILYYTIVFTIYYILYAICYLLYSIYTRNYVLYTIYYILYTMYYILYTIYYILYTIPYYGGFRPNLLLLQLLLLRYLPQTQKLGDQGHRPRFSTGLEATIPRAPT